MNVGGGGVRRRCVDLGDVAPSSGSLRTSVPVPLLKWFGEAADAGFERSPEIDRGIPIDESDGMVGKSVELERERERIVSLDSELEPSSLSAPYDLGFSFFA